MCACSLGARAAKAPAAVEEAFVRYGYALGMAFQLRDDYLDTFGDSKTFGKPIGGDILNGKKTWLYIKARQLDPEALEKAMGIVDSAAKIDAVKALYISHNLDSELDRLIDSYTRDALETLPCEHISREAAEFFVSFAEMLVDRTK